MRPGRDPAENVATLCVGDDAPLEVGERHHGPWDGLVARLVPHGPGDGGRRRLDREHNRGYIEEGCHKHPGGMLLMQDPDWPPLGKYYLGGRMALREDFEAAGNWLFRRRGFVPLLLLPGLFAALGSFRYPASSHRLDLLWEGVCLALSLLGLAVRVATVGFAPPGTSGRNRHEQTAASLNTTGMYSLVRHPLYLGNYFMWLGVAMLPRVWWSPVLVSLAFGLYYERIMFAEEEFLRRTFGATFMDWAARTPAIIPRRLQWQPPSRAFSLRTVLQREYSGLFALILSFTVLELAGDFEHTGKLALDPVWVAAFVTTALLCGVLRALKHRTRAFHQTGDRHP